MGRVRMIWLVRTRYFWTSATRIAALPAETHAVTAPSLALCIRCLSMKPWSYIYLRRSWRSVRQSRNSLCEVEVTVGNHFFQGDIRVFPRYSFFILKSMCCHMRSFSVLDLFSSGSLLDKSCAPSDQRAEVPEVGHERDLHSLEASDSVCRKLRRSFPCRWLGLDWHGFTSG